MKGTVENYIKAITSKFSHIETSEMGYRTDFEILLKEVFASIKISRFDNDPKAKEGNKPDFVAVKDDVPLLYIETKDIGVSLDKVERSEQMGRYFGYANLVLTDYLEFRFYRNGLPYGEPIKIGDFHIKDRTINPIPDNYELLAKTLLEFTQNYKEPIKSGKHLAKIMAGKTRRIRDNIRQFLVAELDKNTDLVKLYNSIKKYLVHDLKIESFADMYAQTLVYGLFIARFNDTTKDGFTRSEARDLIPNSNPFLHRFFDYIAGIDFDNRLKFIVDELCEVFEHSNIEELLKQFSDEDLWGKVHKKPDPVIYFYEDFLKEYDPVLRKKMGAYYTPEPVVQFIVRAVNDILKKDFKLPKGLGDTSKTLEGLHKVQILDPATGTGTFISAVIRSIYKPFKDNKQTAAWPSYVQNELLPRVFGFEIMMAPYTIAHLKLSMAFKDTGFKYFNSKRLGIYLTNSLEDETAQETLFSTVGLSESIAQESIDASEIKNKKPIMVVIGNPPYSGESSNKGEWITNLLNDYKKEPEGNQKLIERNPKWINDDYVKFLRFGQYFIEKNKSGIVAFINPHGFLDNPTFRGMRWNLLKTYDEIYVLNLHGNAKKKETSPDGSKDENVFDIQQGVSINILVKTNKKPTDQLAKVYYADLFGKRSNKFDFLNENTLNSVEFKEITNTSPMYFMVPKDFKLVGEYQKGFAVNELFVVNSVGVVTANDKILIDKDKSKLISKVESHYKIVADEKYIQKIDYRPFDTKYIYYDPSLVERARVGVMKNLLLGNNLGLNLCKQFKTGNDYHHSLVSSRMIESCFVSNKTSEITSEFPLYIMEGEGSPNLDKKIMTEIKNLVGEFTPEDIFDYVYAVLYSPNYREKYKEFLKIDFPRIPYPKDKKQFFDMTRLGKELRDLHLMESPKLDNLITTFNVEGNNIVEKVEYKNGNVYINQTQCFGDVPQVAWNFYIGGYQPAQKWLKDRKGKELTSEDIEHYQKVIKALVETWKIMGDIDKIK